MQIMTYDARGNGDGFVTPTLTGDHQNRITDYTAILCYNDRRHADYHIADDRIAPTVIAKYRTVDGNTPIVCLAIDSHPMDSRMRIVQGACPSLTMKLAKLASDGPLILLRSNG